MSTESESVGSFLRAGRERAGLRLEDVALTTKIARLSLEHLEGERFSQLPPRVFVLGFVRSYAKSVGLCEEIAAQLYRKQMGGSDATLAFVCAEQQSGESEPEPSEAGEGVAGSEQAAESSWQVPWFRVKEFFLRPDGKKAEETKRFGVNSSGLRRPFAGPKKTGLHDKNDRMEEVVMVVLLILVVATITLSLFLKSSNRSTGGLSQAPAKVSEKFVGSS